MAIKLKNCLFAGALLYATVFALYGNQKGVVDDPRWTAKTIMSHESAYTRSGEVPYSKFSGQGPRSMAPTHGGTPLVTTGGQV